MNTLKISIITSYCLLLVSCNTDKTEIARIYSAAQNDSTSYYILRGLCKNYPNRLGGSANSIRAIDYMKSIMEQEKFDTVYLQECTVTHWDRGGEEIGTIKSNKVGSTRLSVCTLGNSVGTPNKGINAEIVEVKSFEELEKLGEKAIKGKIVFFNKPMDATKINSFEAYGEVVGFRFSGASVAANYGAEAVLVRSVTTANDTFPHTGVMRYENTPKQIPAFAISTIHADILSKQLVDDPKLIVHLKSNCKFLADEKSFNVIGEVRGSEFPDEYITVGGHLDSWDNTEGAHDDGGGCVQSIGVWRIFRDIGYIPKRTLRVVMFMDEEMNQRGGRKYAEMAKQKGEKHIFALESDGGCDKPKGFSFDTKENHLNYINSYKNFFEPYGADQFVSHGAGVDIDFLKEDHDIILGELMVDPTHYFDYHHSGYDTFEHINKEFLQQGSASMATIVFLVDKFGVSE